MKTFENIDEILKKGMENYQPTPPADVWAHLEQNLAQAPVGSTQSHLGSAGKIVHAIKSAGIVSKIALLAIVPALLGVYFVIQPDPATNKSMVSPVNESIKTIKSNEITSNSLVLAEPKMIENTAVKKTAGTIGQVVNSSKNKPENSPILPVIENKSNTANPESNSKPQNSDNKSSGEAKTYTGNPAKTETQTKGLEDIVPIPEPKIEDKPKTEPPAPDFKNVITPNGDGINDKFVIEIENPVYYHLIIYDWQEKIVFESKEQNNNWNGTDMKTGMDCEVGYYTYSFDFQLNNSKPIQNKKDIIFLNR